MKILKNTLAAQDYPYREFRLGPPQPENIKAAPEKEDPSAADEEEYLSTDNDAYAKVDVPLKESLRVVSDAISLAQSKQHWVSNRAPLTAAVDDRG